MALTLIATTGIDGGEGIGGIGGIPCGLRFSYFGLIKI